MSREEGKEEKRIKVKIPVYGNVALDEDERDALSLPPKFAQYENIKLLRLKHQQYIRDSKLRYEMKNKDFDPKGRDVTPKEEQQTEEQDIRDQEDREVYNMDTGTIDFRKQRPTDVKSNPKVHLPKPGPLRQEAEIKMRGAVEERITPEYLEKLRGRRT